VDITGEVGILASEFGVAGVPGADGGLDGRLAYARLEIPSGPHQRWLVSAQLMESVLSSWAAQAEWVSERSAGDELRAGVAYGTHLYGDLDAYRPPEAGLRFRPEGDRTTEWFGSAFGKHRMQFGRAQVATSLAYHHYSYLQRTNYLAPSAAVEWAPRAAGGTLLRGSIGYRVLAPGAEDLGLLAQMVTADVSGVAGGLSPRLEAERNLRYQMELTQRWESVGELELRFFREETADQLLKAYFGGRGGAQQSPGWYQLRNLGDFRSHGLGLSFSRRFGSVAGSVGYTFGRYRAVAAEAGSPEEGWEQEMHDLTTTVETAIDRTRTRVYAVYRLSSLPSWETERRVGSRFNVEVNQGLPFPGSVEWEVLVAVRNLFYHDLENASLLDECLVLDSPRRVLGGLAVRF